MSRSRAIVKVAAVSCSVLLAAGFVAYRAGAFSGTVQPESPPPGESSGEPSADSILFDSSKSGRIVQPGAPDVSSTVSHPALISGSKSAIFVVPPQNAAPGGTPPAQTQAPIMPGSKSIAPLIPPKAPGGQSPNPPK